MSQMQSKKRIFEENNRKDFFQVFISRNGGCPHMICSKCHCDFCYNCGKRRYGIKFLGSHESRFSPFGKNFEIDLFEIVFLLQDANIIYIRINQFYVGQFEDQLPVLRHQLLRSLQLVRLHYQLLERRLVRLLMEHIDQ